MKKIKDFAIC